jgi:hypothetical protein
MSILSQVIGWGVPSWLVADGYQRKRSPTLASDHQRSENNKTDDAT